MFLLTEEELLSNLSIFNETCVKWQRKTGRLGMRETYTVSGVAFEIGSSLSRLILLSQQWRFAFCDLFVW